MRLFAPISLCAVVVASGCGHHATRERAAARPSPTLQRGQERLFARGAVAAGTTILCVGGPDVVASAEVPAPTDRATIGTDVFNKREQASLRIRWQSGRLRASCG